jgi:hypothetical protein
MKYSICYEWGGLDEEFFALAGLRVDYETKKDIRGRFPSFHRSRGSMWVVVSLRKDGTHSHKGVIKALDQVHRRW